VNGSQRTCSSRQTDRGLANEGGDYGVRRAADRSSDLRTENEQTVRQKKEGMGVEDMQ
jgi:hypothetical protein